MGNSLEKKVYPVECLSLEKLNWDNQLGKLFYLPSQMKFPISFKPKVAIAKFAWKMKKKVWYYENWFGRHAFFLLDDLLNRESLIPKQEKLFRFRK